MFTGIIEEIGTVKAIKRAAKSITLEIVAQKVLEGTQVGDSICTNGVCLTVTSLGGGVFSADVMPQTMRMTSLGALKPGDKVNLERALTLESRLGGHIVSGHIDGTGKIVKREQEDTALWLHIEAPAHIMRYIIDKGSITVQGVSLTVAKATPSSFAVSLIPHTQNATTLHSAKVGDTVNLENDVIAKYVESFVNGNGNVNVNDDGNDKFNLYRDFMNRA